LKRIARDKKESAAAFARRTARVDGAPFAAPLAVLPEGGRFGARRIFNGEPRSPHGGTDFRAATGTTVFAPAAGVVAVSADHYFAGQSVYIDHGDGLVSMSFHLSERLVKKGDRVKRGQPVGKVGATGRVTGPHLHFAVRLRGARVDPMPLLAPVARLAAID
jgi:murein DD-endopeptidase MepM/ murein hydrolase activator NlpD